MLLCVDNEIVTTKLKIKINLMISLSIVPIVLLLFISYKLSDSYYKLKRKIVIWLYICNLLFLSLTDALIYINVFFIIRHFIIFVDINNP